MSKIISDELYNQILNSNLEQSLKNSLINLQNNNNDISNNSLIGIRTLSPDEYDKYIINGNADCSITVHDNNVYHYQDDYGTGKSYIGYSGSYWDANNATVKSMYHYPNYVLRYNNDQGYVYDTFNCYLSYELGQGSSENNCSIYRGEQCIIDCLGGQSGYYGYVVTSTNDIVAIIDKDVTQKLVDAKISWFRNARGGRSDRAWLNIYYNLNFRPIFIFADNNKSKNIFY